MLKGIKLGVILHVFKGQCFGYSLPSRVEWVLKLCIYLLQIGTISTL